MEVWGEGGRGKTDAGRLLISIATLSPPLRMTPRASRWAATDESHFNVS